VRAAGGVPRHRAATLREAGTTAGSGPRLHRLAAGLPTLRRFAMARIRCVRDRSSR
jgi:hypothetical protein